MRKGRNRRQRTAANQHKQQQHNLAARTIIPERDIEPEATEPSVADSLPVEASKEVTIDLGKDLAQTALLLGIHDTLALLHRDLTDAMNALIAISTIPDGHAPREHTNSTPAVEYDPDAGVPFITAELYGR